MSCLRAQDNIGIGVSCLKATTMPPVTGHCFPSLGRFGISKAAESTNRARLVNQVLLPEHWEFERGIFSPFFPPDIVWRA